MLVVDTDLLIRDVNPAYLRATTRTLGDLLGIPMFEAFPDPPGEADATGVRNLNASFERVFRSARRHTMALQRYDIRAAGDPGTFVRKLWLPVNTPVRDSDGRVIGALHHVEDVTAVAAQIALVSGEKSTATPPGDRVALVLAAFARETAAHQQTRTLVDQLQHALWSRIVIEQAKGMIAARRDIGIEEAFEVLRRHSRNNNIRLRDVARDVVEGDLRP